MKMAHDCDFLDRVDALRSWLGFPISGNPFLFPQQSSTKDQGSANRSSNNREIEFDTIGLADVGRQPWLGPLEFEVVQDGEGAHRDKAVRSKKRKLWKAGADRTVAPYAAPVVNDVTLLPPVKEPSPTRSRDYRLAGWTGGSGVESEGSSPRTVHVGIERLAPNLVSKEDAQRIGVARLAILEEQARVLASTRTQGAADGEGESRRRSRAPSRVFEALPGTSRKDSRSPPTSSPGSPSQRRTSQFGCPSTRRNGSTVGSYGLDSQIALLSSEPGDMSSIVQASAGLLQNPAPEPHPGLGPVLLQSSRPGGELHPTPFLHTVAEAQQKANAGSLEPKIAIRTPIMPPGDRCLTAPTATHSLLSIGDCQALPAPRRSWADHDRPVTAPADIPSKLGVRPSFSGGRKRNVRPLQRRRSASRASCSEVDTAQEGEGEGPSSKHCHRGLRLSRKAGAELRALTAAGTSGRRQPPPREIRLRRLARDVARHSAELRRLVREEDQLRKSLARCNGGGRERPGHEEDNSASHEHDVNENALENDDDAVAAMVSVRCDDVATGRGRLTVDQAATPMSAPGRIEAALEAKRREIELKTFDLGIKRDELRCLRIVQKQERERKLAMEMERRRALLDDGQVGINVKSRKNPVSVAFWCVTARVRSRTARKSRLKDPYAFNGTVVTSHSFIVQPVGYVK